MRWNRYINIQFKNVSRTNANHISYSEINEKVISENQIIINTTPMGMYPAVNFKPEIPYQFINKNHLVVDLIYNPEETQFLKNAKKILKIPKKLESSILVNLCGGP